MQQFYEIGGRELGKVALWAQLLSYLANPLFARLGARNENRQRLTAMSHSDSMLPCLISHRLGVSHGTLAQA